MCAINCTNTLGKQETFIELFGFVFYFNFSGQMYSGPKLSQIALQTLLMIIDTDERDKPNQFAVFHMPSSAR
jgi:hypothetical protein